ncbi:MAG: virulence-associated E family protein [Actinobacteria bacterium]|nr:virulence-associated E family protein [Actinomycetota bacterium]
MVRLDAPLKTLKHDGLLNIATGHSRRELNWKTVELCWSVLVEKLRHTTRTPETYAEYLKMTKVQQDNVKDVGGFVGGSLKGGRRKADAVAWRQVVTLDADYPKGDLWASVEALLGCAAALYSTHKHAPEKPRLRLLVPLSRAVTPDEYQAVARRVAADLGMDFFDDTTYQPHRLMYWPSTSCDGEYVFQVLDAPWLDPGAALARYVDWRDPSFWPESSRTQQTRQKLADRAGDPLEKPGWIGAFCRTYSIEEAIEAFLSDIYEPLEGGRYSYIPGSTTGGLVVYDGGTFAYSYHGTDPVGGLLVNAFDLVRLHRFGKLDEEAEPGTRIDRLPSFRAMQEFAMKDEAVRLTAGREKLAEAEAEFTAIKVEGDNWLKRLEVNKQGAFLSNAHNLKLILRHDPRLADAFALDDFAHRAVVRSDLPWRPGGRAEFWQDVDDSGLRNYLDSIYGITGAQSINDAFNEVLLQQAFHPVREYLDGLGWDGVERLDKLFVDYLGAEDCPYTRTVTRKALTAAVKRVMNPGCKYDYVLVLVGPQGIGKSLTLSKLGGRWFSDSLASVHGKDAYEQLQGMWIIEMGELWATRKADVEAIKLFITKSSDNFRVAYGRHTTVFPRQCVIFGTTNDREFLRDKTGNRRFWPVVVGENEPVKSLWRDLSAKEINQVWAEAVEAWQRGEELYLTPALEEDAQARQELHTEESAKAGAIREFLDTLLPEGWDELDIAARRRFIHGTDFGGSPAGSVARDRVCAMEIWVELFEGDPKQLTPAQAREINDVLRNTPGWQPQIESRGRLYFGKQYGQQRGFVRYGLI